MLDLVGTPEDRFSPDAAHMISMHNIRAGILYFMLFQTNFKRFMLVAFRHSALHVCWRKNVLLCFM